MYQYIYCKLYLIFMKMKYSIPKSKTTIRTTEICTHLNYLTEWRVIGVELTHNGFGGVATPLGLPTQSI